MCSHSYLKMHREKDRCFWVRCMSCRLASPKKSSFNSAMLSFLLRRELQHPRSK